MKFVRLRELVLFYQMRSLRTGNARVNRTRRYLVRLEQQWGHDVPIYEEKGLREQYAQAIAHRLALPLKVVVDDMENCHRLTRFLNKGNL